MKTSNFYGNQYKTMNNKQSKFIRHSKIALSIILIVIISATLYRHYNPLILINTINTTTDISPAMFAQKIDTLQKQVVASVQSCESGGHKESDGIIIFDSNHVASIGTMQFQVHTIIYYYRTLYKQTITGKEAILIALDDTKATALAKDIIFTSPNLANDWLNCSKRLSLTDEIKAIKKITQ